MYISFNQDQWFKHFPMFISGNHFVQWSGNVCTTSGRDQCVVHLSKTI